MEKEKMDIVIVGHVDHGKSTLIGRLLYETNSLPNVKLEQVKEYCRNNSKPFEYAFLLDALKDEQSQGITIDSARCFFNSKKRNYIIIDAPGHIEFLKNMISGAARAEAAILVIDADEGIQENSKRHGYMLSMLGIKQVIIMINKMDLVDYSEEVYKRVKEGYKKFLNNIGIEPLDFIPVSAIGGDNIIDKNNLRWFKGRNVLESLDSFNKEKDPDEKPFRMYIQDVYKFTDSGDKRRIIAGNVLSGRLNVGDRVIFLPSKKKSNIKTIESFNNGPLIHTSAGYSTGFTLTEQIFVKRGELVCKENEKSPCVGTKIRANIFWVGKDSMRIDKWYKIRAGTYEGPVKLNNIFKIINSSNLREICKNSIARNEVAKCELECKTPFAFDIYSEIQKTGRFVIIDDFNIAGGGIIYDSVNTRNNIVWHDREISRKERSEILGHKSALLWFTGLSGSGKSTIAVELQKRLIKENKLTYVLDGDNIRHGLNRDLGFSEKDRIENIRRIGEVASLFVDSGVITMSSFISPYKKDREIIRNKLADDFIEIYVKCSVRECERRDPKGLYKKARNGEIKEFTGITAPYEEPKNPDIIIETDKKEIGECVDIIYEYLKEKSII